MFDRILIPLDGSPRAESILRPIARFLRRRESEFIFVHAIESVRGYPGLDAAALAEKDRQAAKAYLRDLTGRLGPQNVRVSSVIREGLPVDVILQAAQEKKATLIAMATHGRTGLARWPMGSVAEKVLRGAEVPVLLVRSGRTEGTGWTQVPAEEEPFRRILVPTDGSAAAESAQGPAAEIAREFEAEVVVMNATPLPTPFVAGWGGPPPEAPDPAAAERIASSLASRFSDLKIRTRVIGTLGDPAEKILETAASTGADLIAMSTHGRTGLARLGLGSVTERILRGASVPMLVVRSEPKSPAPR